VRKSFELRVQNLICPQGINLSPLSSLLTVPKSCGVDKEGMEWSKKLYSRFSGFSILVEKIKKTLKFLSLLMGFSKGWEQRMVIFM
jgi:hypothetical protein